VMFKGGSVSGPVILLIIAAFSLRRGGARFRGRAVVTIGSTHSSHRRQGATLKSGSRVWGCFWSVKSFFNVFFSL
jgi:hypothetical protein